MIWGARYECRGSVWNVHDCPSKHDAQRELVHWVSENFADGIIGWWPMLRFMVHVRCWPYALTFEESPSPSMRSDT